MLRVQLAALFKDLHVFKFTVYFRIEFQPNGSKVHTEYAIPQFTSNGV